MPSSRQNHFKTLLFHAKVAIFCWTHYSCNTKYVSINRCSSDLWTNKAFFAESHVSTTNKTITNRLTPHNQTKWFIFIYKKLKAWMHVHSPKNIAMKLAKNSYSVSRGITLQITEQARETNRGGGVIPEAMPRLLTSSKYSLEPANTAAERATVKTHSPANTTPPTKTPMPRPKIILFLNWLVFSLCSSSKLPSPNDWLPLWTSYNIAVVQLRWYKVTNY